MNQPHARPNKDPTKQAEGNQQFPRVENAEKDRKRGEEGREFDKREKAPQTRVGRKQLRDKAPQTRVGAKGCEIQNIEHCNSNSRARV